MGGSGSLSINRVDHHKFQQILAQFFCIKVSSFRILWVETIDGPPTVFFPIFEAHPNQFRQKDRI